jgi:hypothetical protein
LALKIADPCTTVNQNSYKTVDEFVGEALRKALSMVGVRRRVCDGLPVMAVSDDTPRIDPAKVRQCLEEEGF